MDGVLPGHGIPSRPHQCGRASLDNLGVRSASPGLLEDLEVTGAHVESSGLDPMADLIRAQRLAAALAEAKGLNPDEPRHLARSVQLS